MRDQYNAKQAGNQGPNSGYKSTTIQTLNEGFEVNISQLQSELEEVKEYLKKQVQSDDTYILIGDITKANRSLSENKKTDAFEILKSCGSKLYDIAKSIGCAILARYLAGALGI